MIRLISGLFYSFISSLVMADDHIVYKQELVNHNQSLVYGSVIIFLCLAIFLSFKKYRFKSNNQALCQVIEKTYLGNKTVIYVIDYQKQRFLLADNQQALSFCLINEENTDAKI